MPDLAGFEWFGGQDSALRYTNLLQQKHARRINPVRPADRFEAVVLRLVGGANDLAIEPFAVWRGRRSACTRPSVRTSRVLATPRARSIAMSARSPRFLSFSGDSVEASIEYSCVVAEARQMVLPSQTVTNASDGSSTS